MKNPRSLLAAIVPLLLIAVLVFWLDGGATPDTDVPGSSTTQAVMAESDAESSEVPQAAGEAAGAEDDEFAHAREIARDYTLTEKEFNKHIMERHGPDSTDPSKSRFSADFDVRQGIDDTLTDEDSVVKPNTGGRDGYLFEKTYKEPIGTDEKGREICTIRVVMGEDGFVVTAFPVK